LANQFNAQAILEISNTAYAQLWQAYRDDMEWAWDSGENERDRLAQLAIAEMDLNAAEIQASATKSASRSSAWGKLAAAYVGTLD
jgi:hypothetical protein